MLKLSAKSLDLPGIAHGFFGRTGGVSDGIYASLNCGLGSGDDPERVAENRQRGRATIGAHMLNTLYHVHSPTVAPVTGAWEGPPPQADAMVTAAPGVALGILTADCAP